ncbi:MAG TPA: VOC family protein [Burkholderiales bacterium]|nr:VOC family protein [Burkholderiales bacterium]
MPRASIDHLAVAAPTLEEGVAWVRERLGAEPGPGGRHERMGTHNRLLRLGEKLYLEVIAIDPAAPSPGRARWFALDRDARIGLRSWAARTDDIAACGWIGAPERMTRGSLQWTITVTPDGSMPMDGIAPTLLQWPPGVHPAATMPDSGCSLLWLEGFHPQAQRIHEMLEGIGFDGPFKVSPAPQPRLVAHIATPAGVRRLDSGTEAHHGGS